jgi:predicted phage baseplate assembly protein
MALEAPNLDSRTFEELVRLARLRIPRYTPEWTDFNESDPGITLVELFAWLTEQILYELNRVPERNYVKFLELLGLEQRPAQPAVAHLVFTAQADAPEVRPVDPGTQVAAQPPDGGPLRIFETTEGLDLARVPLTDVQAFDGSAFTVVTLANESDATPFRPLGWVPQPGSALYLGFTPTEPAPAGRPFPQELRFRVFLPPATVGGRAERCATDATGPAPPATLVWEHKPTVDAPAWRRLSVFLDQTAALTREGDIRVAGPTRIAPTIEGKVAEPRYWLRVRLADGGYPTGGAPELDLIRCNVAPAHNLATVRDEILGTSDGHPGQRFQLAQTPVDRDSLTLSIELAGADPERWTRVDDFFASEPDDPHFVLDPIGGEVRFGDGRRGAIPVAGADIVAVEYRYGGGAAGNVGPGLVSTPLTNLLGVESVTNPRPAVGGRDQQDLEELKAAAPGVLRRRGRAVTAQDFATLAEETGGVRRAAALALAHPDHPEVEVPGAVTVVVVPDSPEVPPVPSRDLIEAVCRRLSSFRLLTSEVYVRAPNYQAISVEAHVDADPFAAAGTVQREVVEALNRHLDPLRRGFGEDLVPTSLFSVILAVRDVRAVPGLAITVQGRPHELAERVVVPAGGLLYGADHQITVTPFRDR